MAGDLFRSDRSHSASFLKLFFVDDGASKFPHSKGDDVLDVSAPAEHPDTSDDGDDGDAQSEASNDSDKPEVEPLPTSPAPASRPPNPKSRKAPAWTDPTTPRSRFRSPHLHAYASCAMRQKRTQSTGASTSGVCDDNS
jgi:hypothetical protein